MSEHRNDFAPAVGCSSPRLRRWVIGTVAAMSLSGLLFGGLLAPVSADDVTGSVGSGVSAGFDGDCVKVAVGGDGAGGSVSPEEDGGPGDLGVTADGTGTSEVSVCRDDPGEGLPEDPGDAVPDDVDPGAIVPDDVNDVVAEVTAAVLGELDGTVPDDPVGGVPGPDDVPGDPGDAVPGDPGDAVPDGLGGLLPDGLGLVPDLLDRIPALVPDGVDTGGPSGNGGDGPVVSPTAGGSGTASVDADAGAGAGEDVLGAELLHSAPAVTGGSVSPTGGTLPRTGGIPGSGLLRMIAVLGIGRAGLRLAARKRA
jgi:hypothetical protein